MDYSSWIMRHRIFIAINFPEDVRQKLLSYQEKIDELFTPYRTGVSGGGPVRWTKSENLHITLVFLGYISDEELVEALEISREVAQRNNPFTINLNKICYGPPGKIPPRMIWVEGEKSEELAGLKSDLENSLTGKINFQREGRAFSLHITLGRMQAWEWRKIEPEERPDVNQEINLSFPVNSIEVMESELKKGGAEYIILESCPLKI